MALFELKVGGKPLLRIGADKAAIVAKNYNVGNSPLDYINSMMYNSNVVDYFEIGTNKTIIKAVNECPQIGTILIRRAQQISNGITTVKNQDGEELSGKLLTKYSQLIDKPNVFMNRVQYVSLREMYALAWGWVAEYKEVVPGFGIKSRRILKPECCEIVWENKSMFFAENKHDYIKSFHYNENGVRTRINDVENIYFYTNPNVISMNGYLPESPLKTLTNPINASIKNYKSRIRSIGSPWGFVSQTGKDDTSNIPMSPDEVEEFHKRYREQYGVEDHQNELMFANGPFQFNPIMPPVKDLQLLELLKSDSGVICDVLGYEFDLLARDIGGVALNNKKEAGRNQYQNYVIPQAKNWDEQEMESLGAAKDGVIIHTTFDHLPIMQADRNEESQARLNNIRAILSQFTSNMISYGEAMEVLQAKTMIEAWRDKFWIDLTDEERRTFAEININATTNDINTTTND